MVQRMGYRLVRAIARLLLWLFYRKIAVTGLERVPAHGPVVIAANHHTQTRRDVRRIDAQIRGTRAIDFDAQFGFVQFE